MKTEIIFSQAISVIDLNLDNEQIIEYCLRKMDEDRKGRVLSNIGGWQSNDFYEPETEIQELASVTKSYVSSFANNFSYTDSLKMDNFWININGKHNENGAHDHPNALIAAVYYASVPENSGHIQFHNPLSTYDKYLNEKFIKSYNMFNSGCYNHYPKENQLIIFPGWLIHSVLPNESNDNRISIAFNFYIDIP